MNGFGVWLVTPTVPLGPGMSDGSPTVFDVIVVGAGVEGSSTAYQLIKNGAKSVLLLEQV